MIAEDTIWEQAKEGFSANIPKPEFETWFAQTTLKRVDSTKATIQVPNKFVARWLKENYSEQIRIFFKEKLQIFPKLQFVHEKPPSASEPSCTADKARSQEDETINSTALNPDFPLISLIKRKANKANLHLREDVLFFLANTVQDFEQIDIYLQDLKIRSSLYERAPGMPMVQAILKSRLEEKLSLQTIQELTAGYFNIPLQDLLSSKKKRDFSYPRQVAVFLARNLTGLTMKEIGNAFGRKDHSPVVYALRHIENEQKKNPRIKEDINHLKDFLLTWSHGKKTV